MKLRLLVVGVSLLVGACGTRRIPGTDIADNRDTRAILRVMELYRAALEARNPTAIQALVGKNFHDDAGTDTPEDDLTYATLAQELPQRLQHLENVKVEMSVRRIAIEGDLAAAIYYWNASFRTPRLTSRAHQESELEQMLFQRQDGEWRIVSGI